MDVEQYKQLAKLIRDNKTYKVYDLPQLEDLDISLTELHSKESTTGHSHSGADEVYIFFDGEGIIEIDSEIITVKAGDIIPVKEGAFHKVYNKGNKDLKFWAIFEKYEGRGK